MTSFALVSATLAMILGTLAPATSPTTDSYGYTWVYADAASACSVTGSRWVLGCTQHRPRVVTIDRPAIEGYARLLREAGYTNACTSAWYMEEVVKKHEAKHVGGWDHEDGGDPFDECLKKPERRV